MLFDAAIAYDVRLFEGLNRVVQAEPWLERDRTMIDQLRCLGIGKGKPFAPDARARELLDAAAQEAQAWLECVYDAGFPPFWEDSRWTRTASPSTAPVTTA